MSQTITARCSHLVIILLVLLFFVGLATGVVVAAPPSAPTGLTAVTASPSQINLSWNDNSLDETGFEIERSTNGGAVFSPLTSVSVNVSTYSSGGLAAGTQYCYRVRTINGDGPSAYTGTVCALTRISFASYGLPRLDTLLAGRTFTGIVPVNPGDDLQAAITAHPPNTIFLLKTGVHRLQSTVPRDGDVFIGQSGTVMTGAETLTLTPSGGYWIASGQTQPVWTAGMCEPGYDGCNLAYDVYVDNIPLRHVLNLADVVPGTWYFDYLADRIVLADDPTGHTVETSIASCVFDGTAANVVIGGLTIEKYAGPGQTAAICAHHSTDWIVLNNTVRLNSGGGIGFGDGMQILDNTVISNGQIGISGIGDNVLVEGNEIASNNYAHYDPGWEAGGTKFVATDGLVVRNNTVHHNRGPGLWTDIDNINTLYEGNRVTYNTWMGIFHEISYDAIIRDNQVAFNGLEFDSWAFGAQIQLSTSSNVEVYNNTLNVGAKGRGIVVVEQNRGAGAYGPHMGRDNTIHHNTVTYTQDYGETGAATDWIHADFWANSHNNFDWNTYIACDLNYLHWAWSDATLTWANFQTFAQEANGTLIDCAAVPTTPAASPAAGESVGVNSPVEPAVNIFDPAISKIGILLPGQLGLQGESLEWQITVSTNGTGSASNVVITDTLRDELRVDRVDCAGCGVSINGQTVSVTIPALAAGQRVTFSIFTTVLESSVVVENTACVRVDTTSDRCATATASPIRFLPRTGETPVWRPLVLLILVTGLAGILLLVRRRHIA